MECRECGGRLAFHTEYVDSGVRGPCGERELTWQEWYECLACGVVEEELDHEQAIQERPD